MVVGCFWVVGVEVGFSLWMTNFEEEAMPYSGETVDHLLLNCKIAQMIWTQFSASSDSSRPLRHRSWLWDHQWEDYVEIFFLWGHMGYFGRRGVWDVLKTNPSSFRPSSIAWNSLLLPSWLLRHVRRFFILFNWRKVAFSNVGVWGSLLGSPFRSALL